MKKYILFYIIIVPLLFLGACNADDLSITNDSKDARTLLITASIPKGDPTTRVTLEEREDKTIALTWEIGDQLQLLFVQGEIKIKTVVAVESVFEDGKKAGFNVIVPKEIELKEFDLYGVYGGGGLSDDNPTHVVFPTYPGSVSSIEELQSRKDVMLSFEYKNFDPINPPAAVSFKHLGSIFNVTLKNNSFINLNNISEVRLVGVGGDGDWAYNSGAGGTSYDIVNGEFLNSETAGNFISFKAKENTLKSKETISFWGWYPPLPNKLWPELVLQLRNQNEVVARSVNSLPRRYEPTDSGKSYYFYTSWNGSELMFTDDVFIEGVLEVTIDKLYNIFKEYMPNESAIGASRHNDFGYPSIMSATDANGEDVVSEDNGYNWFGNSLTYQDRSSTSYESQIVWNNFYSYINTANIALNIDAYETQDPNNQFYLAQALAVRAFSYFGLAQLYQYNYKGNESKPCVPIITEKNTIDVIQNGAPRATVQEVYDLILADLNLAINFLKSANEGGVYRYSRKYIDLAVAYGLRARVFLTMHKYLEARADADKAIAVSDATPTSLTEANKPAFMNSNERNWMWGVVIYETDRVVTAGIVNWPSHMGSLNYGYANFSGGRQISRKLFETIPKSDIRKGWWIDEYKTSVNLNYDQQATMDSYDYKAYTHVKFAPYNYQNKTSTNANDIPLMRIEEMYLIKAEAEVAISGSAAVLERFLQTYRDPKYSFSGSPKAIQEEIFRQRRIELWGEGLNWYDIMRLNKGVDRRGAGFPNASSVFHIPAHSDILLWRIPESEIESNPALSDGDNNPEAPTPNPVEDWY